MTRYLSCCGLFCGACSSMLLKEKQDKVEDASHFVCDFDESPCEGCGEGNLSTCEFIMCCKDNGIENCAFCSKFPCEMLIHFSKDEWPHHIEVIENLKFIKKHGIEAWINQQREIWSCSSCQARTHWYQKSCTKCGEAVKHHY